MKKQLMVSRHLQCISGSSTEHAGRDAEVLKGFTNFYKS